MGLRAEHVRQRQWSGPVAQTAPCRGQALALEPFLEFGCALQAQRVVQEERVVERGALVVEHDVVRPRHADEEVEPGGGQQHQQCVHVVLVGLGMVGVADVATHGQSHQLAAEVVFQPGADDLLAVIEVFGADEAHHRVHQQRVVAARQRIGAHFAGLLVHAVVAAGREGAALAGLEVHDVVAHGAAPQLQGGVVGLVEHGDAHAEAAVGLLGAADGLEHQVHRHARVHELQRVGDVGQHAGLGGNLQALDQRVEHAAQALQRGHAVGHRVDADHGVARAQHQPVQHRGRHAAQVVGRVVGLQPHGDAAGQPQRVAKACDHAALARHGDQVLVAHDLAHRRHHLGREPGRQSRQCLGRGRVAQQPVAPVAHRHVADGREGGGIVAVDDQAGDGIVLVGHQCLVQEGGKRQVGQHVARGHALLRGGRAHAGQVVARARRAGVGHHLAQVVEGMALAAQGGVIAHGGTPLKARVSGEPRRAVRRARPRRGGWR